MFVLENLTCQDGHTFMCSLFEHEPAQCHTRATLQALQVPVQIIVSFWQGPSKATAVQAHQRLC